MTDKFLLVESALNDASAEVSDLVAALAKSQAIFPAIPKTKTGKVTGENAKGQRYEFTYLYADLSDMQGVCRPILAGNGIAIIQRLSVTGVRLDVETVMMKGEQWMRSVIGMQFNGKNPAQALGSMATYLKRYAYSAMIGVQAEEDTDEQQPDNGHDEAPRRVEDRPASVEGGISPAEQKILKDGMAVTGVSLQKLLTAVWDHTGTDVNKLADIPADAFEVAHTFLKKSMKE